MEEKMKIQISECALEKAIDMLGRLRISYRQKSMACRDERINHWLAKANEVEMVMYCIDKAMEAAEEQED